MSPGYEISLTETLLIQMPDSLQPELYDYSPNLEANETQTPKRTVKKTAHQALLQPGLI